jgi:hypothetical protein
VAVGGHFREAGSQGRRRLFDVESEESGFREGDAQEDHDTEKNENKESQEECKIEVVLA